MQYVPSPPLQGALYHRLAAQIATNYAGLQAQNVAMNPYRKLVGQTFQKPASGVSAPVTLPVRAH